MATSAVPPGRDLSDPGFRSDFRAAIDRMIAALSGETWGIAVGERAPDFSLPAANGQMVSLQERLAGGPVVVSFYRGAWCPVCNTELHALQEVLSEIHARGARLIAVSPQAPDSSRELVEKLSLDFDVLSDLDQHVSAAYGIRFRVSDDLERLYTEMGRPLSAHSADGSWDLPVPATFVLDRAGVVRARHVDADYRQRMDPHAILTALDEIGEHS